MATITVRNLKEETVRAIKVAAAGKSRSMEEEVRGLLEGTYTAPARITPEEAQRRFAALWNGKPPENMVDRFLAGRKKDFDD